MVLELPKIDRPLKGIPSGGASASYALWYRKEGAVAAEGETLMSWSSAAWYPKVGAAAPEYVKTPDAAALYISSDFRLHFVHVEDATEDVLDKATLTTERGPATVIACAGRLFDRIISPISDIFTHIDN